MAINTNQMFTPGQNLTPEQLMQMLGLANNPERSGSMPGKFGPQITFDPNEVQRGTSVGADAEYMPDPSGAGQSYISQPRNVSSMGGNDTTDVWDQTGKYIGPSSGMTDLRGLATILAMAAGGAYTNGGFGVDPSTASAASSGLTGWDAAMGDLASSGGLTAGDFAAGTAAAGGAVGGGSAGLTGVDAAMADLAGSTSLTPATVSAGTGAGSQLMNGAKAAYDAIGGAKGLVTLAGGIAGAADGGDKEASSTRDPWAPAQDFLKQQIAQGQNLSTQYQANPFSQSQQAAYGNLGGLLDNINSNAGGLLGGFGANASGANNFDRNNPRRQLTGGTAMNLQGWMPSLLGNFGTTKGG